MFPVTVLTKGRDLPYSLLEAIEVFRQSEEMMELLGEKFVQMYSQIKSDEYDAFMQVISPWGARAPADERISRQYMTTTLHLNDRPGSYPDSYYHATAVGLVERTNLSMDTTADVCIIGGGFTGCRSPFTLRAWGSMSLTSMPIAWDGARQGATVGKRVAANGWIKTLLKTCWADLAREAWRIGIEAQDWFSP